MPSLARRLAARAAGRLAPAVPLAALLRLVPRGPIGFFYHVVSDVPLPHIRHLYPTKNARAFEKDLAWLNTHFNPAGPDALRALALDGAPLPPESVFLSFDDGCVECATIAAPLLMTHGLGCIFFLTTDWIDNAALFYRSKVSLVLDALDHLSDEPRRGVLAAIAGRFDVAADSGAAGRWLRSLQQQDEPTIDIVCDLAGVDPDGYLQDHQPYLDQDQIRRMQADGFIFGAHSRRHAKLGTLDPREQVEEIVASCRLVADLTGEPRVPFAFPFSGDGVSRAMLADLRRRHPFIGPIFDTKKLHREPDILHRIWADKPVPGVKAQDNLAYWLRDAYRRLAAASAADEI